ncbi:SdpI family protein [Paraurantiacibacter namhicola]|uniref:Immunity protein SdpI n=1 Tax=Paraurantiacibacter namhicola TaxID=645517 RepID=A0A1C7DAV6_9SPHN|nr:SdpI family protein [Paraurantiacibacter namhicola]ANU08512.1 Immunity protein SdpI [Paraurantiacibacter namhicola]
MKTRKFVFVSLLLAAAMAVFAFVTDVRLPDGTLLPTHWNASGEADAFSPALHALLFPVGMVLFVTAVFWAIPRIEPLQEKLEQSAPILRATWTGMLAIALLIQFVIGAPAYGFEPPINLIGIGVGLLLILLGNALPKSRPGFFVGIRTPWAILDTDNWIATHRLGGKLMILAGVVIIAAALLPISPGLRAVLFVGSVLTAALLPFIYSWWLWQRKKSA